jgi:hypothetical protein
MAPEAATRRQAQPAWRFARGQRLRPAPSQSTRRSTLEAVEAPPRPLPDAVAHVGDGSGARVIKEELADPSTFNYYFHDLLEGAGPEGR